MLDVFFFSGTVISTGLLVVLVGLVLLAILTVAAPSHTIGLHHPHATSLVPCTVTIPYSSGDLLLSIYTVSHTYTQEDRKSVV